MWLKRKKYAYSLSTSEYFSDFYFLDRSRLACSFRITGWRRGSRPQHPKTRAAASTGQTPGRKGAEERLPTNGGGRSETKRAAVSPGKVNRGLHCEERSIQFVYHVFKYDNLSSILSILLVKIFTEKKKYL